MGYRFKSDSEQFKSYLYCLDEFPNANKAKFKQVSFTLTYNKLHNTL